MFMFMFMFISLLARFDNLLQILPGLRMRRLKVVQFLL